MAVAGAVMTSVGIYVLFNINNAMAEHDGYDKAHPQSMAAVVAVAADVNLLAKKSAVAALASKVALSSQKMDSTQTLNMAAQVSTKESFARLEKSNERMIELMVSSMGGP